MLPCSIFSFHFHNLFLHLTHIHYFEIISAKDRHWIRSNFYDAAFEAWTQYSQADDRLMALAKQGDIDGARAILEGECVDLYITLNGAFDNIINYYSSSQIESTVKSPLAIRARNLFSSSMIRPTIWQAP